MYRIWDIENEMWVNQPNEDGYVDSFFVVMPNEEIFYIEQKEKRRKIYFNVYPTKEGAYFYHNDTQVYDVDGTLIYEGDIVQMEDSVCIVSYFDVISGFALVDLAKNDAFAFRPEVHKCKVIGNVFEDQDIIAKADSGGSEDEELTMTVDYYIKPKEGEEDA